jgi:hypothetical protein
MAKFLPGNPGGPGRPRGVKDKVAVEFLTALLADFEKGGAKAIEICRIEDPVAYTRIFASLMPRDLQIEHAKMSELTDEELDLLLEHLRERRARLIEQKT